MSYLKRVTIEDLYGFDGENTPNGELRTIEPVRMVGTAFEGSTIDSNFWTTNATGTGSPAIAQANTVLTLTSGTGSGALVTAYSVRRARYVPGCVMRYRGAVQLGDTGTVNNKRRWGIGYGSSMPTVTDGAWFQLNGTEFSINTQIGGGTPTKVTSFNGQLGTSYTPGTNVVIYEIYYTTTQIYFVIGDEILHTVDASTSPWSSTNSPYVFMDSTNSGTLSASVTIAFRSASIFRLGKMETAPMWHNFNTTAVTAYVLKRGPGRLHKVTFNTIPNSCVITLYDGVTAINPICVMNPPNGAFPFAMDFDLDFYNGLCVTTTPNTTDCTVVYE